MCMCMYVYVYIGLYVYVHVCVSMHQDLFFPPSNDPNNNGLFVKFNLPYGHPQAI